MDMRLFTDNIIPFPWWLFAWDKSLGTRGALVGEDIRVCRILEQRGVEMWIDHDLSKDIKHLGEWDYSHQQVPGYYETGPESQHEEARAIAHLRAFVWPEMQRTGIALTAAEQAAQEKRERKMRGRLQDAAD